MDLCGSGLPAIPADVDLVDLVDFVDFLTKNVDFCGFSVDFVKLGKKCTSVIRNSAVSQPSITARNFSLFCIYGC